MSLMHAGEHSFPWRQVQGLPHHIPKITGRWDPVQLPLLPGLVVDKVQDVLLC